MRFLIAYLSGLVLVVCYLTIEPRHANKYLSFLTMIDERKTPWKKWLIIISWPLVLLEQIRKQIFFLIPVLIISCLQKIRGEDKPKK